MRAIWSGSIGFGLVNIPVKMFSATMPGRLDLDMLDSKDHSNIRFMRVNEKTGKEVKWENIVKGYKLENDEYVVLTEEDFAKAAAEKNQLIEIKEFADESAIDIVYHETPYYLVPDKNGEKAYALLREALMKTKKVGVAVFVMRTKETLAILKADKNLIVLDCLRFPEEVKSPKEFALTTKSAIKDTELKMAIRLIEEGSGKFDITAYKNTYREQLMKLIKAKSKGIKIKTPHMKVVQTKSKDLMSKLKASLKQKKAA
jgi:DNA end-binding protein Ku